MKNCITKRMFSNLFFRHLLLKSGRLLRSFTTKRTCDIDKIRNIGIMAHIDAGKTTTTERMLFYSGLIKYPGEVHKGDTVMDFMEQERERGITIASASISFPWLEHQINLIDTPGHVDFTVEVEKSLRVLDGAIAILDSSAGVEAQTLTVWRQADHYNVPRIIYLNKMDKKNSNLEKCLDQIERKLKAIPLQVNFPLGCGPSFSGIIDLPSFTIKSWELAKDPFGLAFFTREINKAKDPDVWEEAWKKREELVERIADMDDEMAELLLSRESVEKISGKEIQKCLRKVTIARKGVPLLCGSSYRNIGVQPLMDAVVEYLPSPKDRDHSFAKPYATNKDLCALSFKIQHDAQKGPLTFVRIYCGSIETGQKLYNVTQSKAEKSHGLFVASADDLTPVPVMSEGNIAVITGLKDTFTGDTITSGLTAANAARRSLARERNVPESEVAPVLAGVVVPDPVFFCSIETASQVYQKRLDQALKIIQREDPSVKVKIDEETGQTVLSGMGELHLEVILQRIRSEFGVDATLGPIQVAYKETITSDSTDTFVLDKILAGTKQFVKITMATIADLSVQGEINLEMGDSKETKEHLSTVFPIHLKAVQRGVLSAVSAGPLVAFPVTGVRVFLQHLEVGPRTSELMVAAAATQCLSQLLRKSGTHLMEPLMKLEVSVEEHHLHAVLGDLNQHRSDIIEITQRDELKVVFAETPLSELRGYAKRIRILTSGTATFSMEFSRYRLMSEIEQRSALQELTGFEV